MIGERGKRRAHLAARTTLRAHIDPAFSGKERDVAPEYHSGHAVAGANSNLMKSGPVGAPGTDQRKLVGAAVPQRRAPLAANMRILLSLGIAICGIACGGPTRVTGTARLAPSSVFTTTSFTRRDAFGNDWNRTDIYVHHPAGDSAYVGSLNGVDTVARNRRRANWAISNDGRSIVFEHEPPRVSGLPTLERGLYQYVYGIGLKRLTPPFGHNTLRAAEVQFVGNLPLPIPFHVMSVPGIDTVWALAATGEMFPMILLDASPLHRAAFAGRTDECSALIRDGANVDSVTRWSHTALDLAIIGGHTATVVRLLELGAKPTAGASALPLAVSLSRTEMVDAMLRRGMSPNTTDAQRNTLLHLAVTTLMRDARITGLMARVQMPRPLIEHDIPVKLVALLLDRGADKDLRDAAGKTPLDLVTAALHEPQPSRSAAKSTQISPQQQQRISLGYDSSPDSGPQDREQYATARQKYLIGLQTLLTNRR